MEFKSPAEEQQYLFKVELPNLITRITLAEHMSERKQKTNTPRFRSIKKGFNPVH